MRSISVRKSSVAEIYIRFSPTTTPHKWCVVHPCTDWKSLKAIESCCNHVADECSYDNGWARTHMSDQTLMKKIVVVQTCLECHDQVCWCARTIHQVQIHHHWYRYECVWRLQICWTWMHVSSPLDVLDDTIHIVSLRLNWDLASGLGSCCCAAFRSDMMSVLHECTYTHAKGPIVLW